MGMKIQGNDRIWGLAIAGVFLGFLIWGFQGSRPLTMLAIFDFVLPILGLAFPSKYQPHLFTTTILLMAGVLVGVSLEKLFGNVPLHVVGCKHVADNCCCHGCVSALSPPEKDISLPENDSCK